MFVADGFGNHSFPEDKVALNSKEVGRISGPGGPSGPTGPRSPTHDVIIIVINKRAAIVFIVFFIVVMIYVQVICYVTCPGDLVALFKKRFIFDLCHWKT